MCLPKHYRGHTKKKLENRVKDSPAKVIEKDEPNERLQKKVQFEQKTNSNKKWTRKFYGDVNI